MVVMHYDVNTIQVRDYRVDGGNVKFSLAIHDGMDIGGGKWETKNFSMKFPVEIKDTTLARAIPMSLVTPLAGILRPKVVEIPFGLGAASLDFHRNAAQMFSDLVSYYNNDPLVDIRTATEIKTTLVGSQNTLSDYTHLKSEFNPTKSKGGRADNVVLMGGGKESLLTYLTLKDLGYDAVPLFITFPSYALAHKNYLMRAMEHEKHKSVKVWCNLNSSQGLLEPYLNMKLTADGARNGKTMLLNSYTAMYMIAAARFFGKTVWMGNAVHDVMPVIHQGRTVYKLVDQSPPFADLYHTHYDTQVTSMVWGLSGFLAFKILYERHPELALEIYTCVGPPATSRSCNKCHKCAYMWLFCKILGIDTSEFELSSDIEKMNPYLKNPKKVEFPEYLMALEWWASERKSAITKPVWDKWFTIQKELVGNNVEANVRAVELFQKHLAGNPPPTDPKASSFLPSL